MECVPTEVEPRSYHLVVFLDIALIVATSYQLQREADTYLASDKIENKTEVGGDRHAVEAPEHTVAQRGDRRRNYVCETRRDHVLTQ